MALRSGQPRLLEASGCSWRFRLDGPASEGETTRVGMAGILVFNPVVLESSSGLEADGETGAGLGPRSTTQAGGEPIGGPTETAMVGPLREGIGRAPKGADPEEGPPYLVRLDGPSPASLSGR